MSRAVGQSVYAGFLAITAIFCFWVLGSETETPVSAQSSDESHPHAGAQPRSPSVTASAKVEPHAPRAARAPAGPWHTSANALSPNPPVAPNPEQMKMPQTATNNSAAAGEVERRAQGFSLTEIDQRLKEAFGDDEVGRRLFNGFLATRHMTEIAGGEANLDALHEHYTQWFRNNPEAVKTAVERALPKLDAEEFGPERAAILSILSTLPGQQTSTRDLALKEFTENVVAPSRADINPQSSPEELESYYSASTKHYVAIAAHQTFLDTQPSPEDATAKTIDGLRIQPDRNVQLSLARQLVQRYPAAQNQILRDLRNAGMDFKDSDLAP